MIRYCHYCDCDLELETDKVYFYSAKLGKDVTNTEGLMFGLCATCFNSGADDILKNEEEPDDNNTCAYCCTPIWSNEKFFYSYSVRSGTGNVHTLMHEKCYIENINIFPNLPKQKELVWDSLGGITNNIIQGSQRILNQNLGAPETTIVSPDTLKQLEKLQREFQESTKEYLKKEGFLKLHEYRPTNSVIRGRTKNRKGINLRRSY